jgi:dolichyl-phosphate beta-glucosyltransferase
VSSDRCPDFSFVVPAFNESKRLGATLPRMLTYLRNCPELTNPEIVIVDDGSSDTTAEDARRLIGDFPGRVISYPENQGKGHAVKIGMLAARGKIRLFSDADLSTPIEEIPRFLAAHRAGHQVVIGSRKRPGAKVIVRQPFLRESMGKVFTFLSCLLVVSGVTDFTCGFKSFTADAADTVFPHMQVKDWSYDAELLFLVRRLGLPLKEVPVAWQDDPDTRVNRMGDAVSSLMGLLKLFQRRISGREVGR